MWNLFQEKGLGRVCSAGQAGQGMSGQVVVFCSACGAYGSRKAVLLKDKVTTREQRKASRAMGGDQREANPHSEQRALARLQEDRRVASICVGEAATGPLP